MDSTSEGKVKDVHLQTPWEVMLEKHNYAFPKRSDWFAVVLGAGEMVEGREFNPSWHLVEYLLNI